MSEKMSIEEYKEKMEELFDECEKVLAQFKGDTLAELKESKKEKWKPQLGEDYWFRNDEEVMFVVPMFETQLECERYWHFMDTVKEKSYEFSKEEWKDVKVFKHFIAYNNTTNEWGVSHDWATRSLGRIYFKTEEDAQYIIDNFKDELMEYWI